MTVAEELVEQFIIPTEELKSRMPRELHAVTYTGRTAKGRRTLGGFTFRSKTDADRRFDYFSKLGFENVQQWTSTLEWTEVQK